MRKAIDKSYAHAIAILDGRRRVRRPSAQTAKATTTVGALPSAGNAADLRGIPSIVGMKDWLYRIGHDSLTLDKLNVIHVAGTKGKGSTCAFIESFLRSAGRTTGFPAKTGLYTSPHLVWPEERIRLNFQPVRRDLFAQYFFEVWDALRESEEQGQRLPQYLQLMALTAFHTFIREGVDAAVIETHHGGEFDATNIIDHPVATVVTPLGMDHIKQLGPTIQDIAWHKSGIFKKGTPAFSAKQPSSTVSVLKNRALEKDTTLQFIDTDAASQATDAVRPDVQRQNCILGRAVAEKFLEIKHKDGIEALSTPAVETVVSELSWPGRFQRIEDGNFTWFLDGAHNEMSVGLAAEWFLEQSQNASHNSKRVVIFGQVTESRNSRDVVRRFTDSLRSANVSEVILTSYDMNRDFNSSGSRSDLKTPPVDSEFVTICQSNLPESAVVVIATAEAAMHYVRAYESCPNNVHVLVTGSQHLVGEVLFNMDHPSIRTT